MVVELGFLVLATFTTVLLLSFEPPLYIYFDECVVSFFVCMKCRFNYFLIGLCLLFLLQILRWFSAVINVQFVRFAKCFYFVFSVVFTE